MCADASCANQLRAYQLRLHYKTDHSEPVKFAQVCTRHTHGLCLTSLHARHRMGIEEHAVVSLLDGTLVYAYEVRCRQAASPQSGPLFLRDPVLSSPPVPVHCIIDELEPDSVLHLRWTASAAR